MGPTCDRFNYFDSLISTRRLPFTSAVGCAVLVTSLRVMWLEQLKCNWLITELKDCTIECKHETWTRNSNVVIFLIVPILVYVFRYGIQFFLSEWVFLLIIVKELEGSGNVASQWREIWTFNLIYGVNKYSLNWSWCFRILDSKVALCFTSEDFDVSAMLIRTKMNQQSVFRDELLVGEDVNNVIKEWNFVRSPLKRWKWNCWKKIGKIVTEG